MCAEGDSGASFAWLCVYTRLFHPPELRSPSSSRQFAFSIPPNIPRAGGSSCLGRGVKAHGHFGLGRLFLRPEGGFACGGRCCRAYVLVTGYYPRVLPSRDKIALRLLSAGLTVRFCSSPGRIFMSREGFYVSGGWFCVWRVVLAHILPAYVSTPDIFTLQGLRGYRNLSRSK